MLPVLVNLVQNDLDKFMNGVIVEDVKVQLLENDIENNDYNKIFIKVAFSYKELKSTTEVIITNNNL